MPEKTLGIVRRGALSGTIFTKRGEVPIILLGTNKGQEVAVLFSSANKNVPYLLNSIVGAGVLVEILAILDQLFRKPHKLAGRTN